MGRKQQIFVGKDTSSICAVFLSQLNVGYELLLAYFLATGKFFDVHMGTVWMARMLVERTIIRPIWPLTYCVTQGEQKTQV